MGLYADMLRSEADVHVPEVLPELSTRRLLTMDWLHGRPLLEFKDAPLEQRNRIAYNMFRAWYVPFYDYARDPRRSASRQLHGARRISASTCSTSAASGCSGRASCRA